MTVIEAMGSIGRRIAAPGKNMRPYLQKNN
jgi:hypothetical protein